MAELITKEMRIAIKTMASISQCTRVLGLTPTPEAFATRLIGDMKFIAKRINSISTRIDGMLDKYSSIPTEFLLEGFDVILDRLRDMDDYAKFAISETESLMTTVTKSVKEVTDGIGSAFSDDSGVISKSSSAVLQVGGELSYAASALGANLKLTIGGDGNRIVENDNISNWTESLRDKVEGIVDDNVGGGIAAALDTIVDVKNKANDFVDNSIGDSIEAVENAKRKVEDIIKNVKDIFENLTKDFGDSFGFVNGNSLYDNSVDSGVSDGVSNINSTVAGGVVEITKEATNFVKNFNIGKVVTSIGGIAVGAGAATIAMDLLPNVNVDRMLRDIIGGIDRERVDKMAELYINKYNEDRPELVEVPDFPWMISIDDLEKYNANGYNEYLEKYADINDDIRAGILDKFRKTTNCANISLITEEDKEKIKENKSALKAMRKVRRDAIKAKQIDKYKKFLNIEIESLKRDCMLLKDDIKSEWDLMISQYKTAISEITNFFNVEGCGGSEVIDKCCDRINSDASEILELCQSITMELVNSVSMVFIPYSIGTCVDMPVHKILAYFKDFKIIFTFLQNLIRLGIDIISQCVILAKIIFSGVKSLMDILSALKSLFGVDNILSSIDTMVNLFNNKMCDSKLLLENSISPIYYNETEEYEEKVANLEALLGDGKDGGEIDKFYYSDDINAKSEHRREFGGQLKTDDEIENALEELESKGEREIVAYRSPILNESGDDFVGWIFYHAYAYDNMRTSWSKSKKRRRNSLIKKASKKNKMNGNKLVGGVAQLKGDKSFGKYVSNTNGKKHYVNNSVTGFDAYYWYTKWTNNPTDCSVDMSNTGEDVVVPIQTTSNGSLVQLSDGRRVFVEGKIVKSGDFVNVDGVKYKVK